ncbi:MAG: CoA pyrophosphatase [Alphaproteobacteria bacterium]|nr:CoA pyrophosphatase [Alphaproteobacteria bacterium]
MQIDTVLERLRTGAATVPEAFAFSSDMHITTRAAAVIVPLLDYGGRVTLLLTKRTSHLTAHAGQICFPGGVREKNDANLLATAQRETLEELAIPADAMRVVAQGRERVTATGYHITPFFAHIHAPIAIVAEPAEVEAVFELPLDLALDCEAYTQKTHRYKGVERCFDVLKYKEYCIWGATAGILRDMCRMIHNECWEQAEC